MQHLDCERVLLATRNLNAVINNPALPSAHLARVTENLNFALGKLGGNKTSITPLIREAAVLSEPFAGIEVKYSESMSAIRIGRP